MVNPVRNVKSLMQFTLKYNPGKNGLKTLFREWQITTLRLLWDNPETRFTTKEVWNHVKSMDVNRVSRATVYHFLDEMKEKEIVKYDMGSGRGGMRVLFYSEIPESEFKRIISENLIKSIRNNLG